MYDVLRALLVFRPIAQTTMHAAPPYLENEILNAQISKSHLIWKMKYQMLGFQNPRIGLVDNASMQW